MNDLRNTSESKHIIAPRVLAGLPLVAFGVMHLAGMMPMKPLLEAAGLPAPGLMAILAPAAQVIAGLMLLSGALARIGGLLAAGTMAGAVLTHVKIPNDAWPTPNADGTQGVGPEPTFMMYLAVVIALCGLYVLWRGGGAWSFDVKSREGVAGSAGGNPSAEVSGG